MKKKLKLAFDQLQNELQLLNIVCQKQIQGGVTVDEVMAYYSYLGFQFVQDANGDYYSGPLGDGDCPFNNLSVAMYGTSDYASVIKLDYLSLYSSSSQQVTTPNGDPAWALNNNDMSDYLTSKGFFTEYDGTPTFEEISNSVSIGNSPLVSYNYHAYIVESVSVTKRGKQYLILKDTTSGDTLRLRVSDLQGGFFDVNPAIYDVLNYASSSLSGMA